MKARGIMGRAIHMKENGKRSLRMTAAFALAVMMMVLAFAWTVAQTDACAASGSPGSGSKIALSKTRISMETSGTAKLKVKNCGKYKVKWSSSDSKIVRIKKKSGKHGQNTVLKAGKKTGTCTIKAKVGKKTLKCKVTVKAAAPPEREIETLPLSDSSQDLTEGIQFDPGETVSSSDSEEIFRYSFADFSLRLLQKAREHDLSLQPGSVNSNILVSPDSVLTALMMTENGAAGQTLSEMQSLYGGAESAEMIQNDLVAMHARLTHQDFKDDIIYELANSIWARNGEIDVSKEFLRKNKSLHNAQYFLAPFDDQTVTDMNNWVYNNTRNMIDKIIGELDEDSVMVLINAIAFEGKWAEPFETKQIDDNGKFTDAAGSAQKATMLNAYLDEGRPYIELGKGQGFVKMYQGGKIAFAGILPPEGVTADEYLDSLTGEDFIDAWDKRSGEYDVRIRLPEFSYDYGCSMKEVLWDMGMKKAFTEFAEFSNMVTADSKVQELMVGDVLHKTHIELDRKGTKAAAATAVIVDKASSIPVQKPVKKVFLDRPFIYALVDTETGIPLFIGEVNTLKAN